ncbi:hypothetical protein EGJ55_22505 [Pseudomonas moraviensis]|nr:hypothetical protein EGJ55_22505 [Pseudomonas moraviensis]
MGMYIAIADGVGRALTRGVFDCIVERTRACYLANDSECMLKIYEPLDEQGQSFISLRDVDVLCFNVFYIACEKAMNSFPESEMGKSVPFDHLEGVLWNWREVLGLMRTDDRYRG